MEDEIGPASQKLIARLWQEEWGLPNVSVRRQYMPTDVEGLAWRAGDGNEIGLVRLHLDAMDGVRRAKPQVPLIGDDGIPLRDMWKLEREL